MLTEGTFLDFQVRCFTSVSSSKKGGKDEANSFLVELSVTADRPSPPLPVCMTTVLETAVTVTPPADKHTLLLTGPPDARDATGNTDGLGRLGVYLLRFLGASVQGKNKQKQLE